MPLTTHMKPAYIITLAALLLSTSSCHIGRFFTRNFANITDHQFFPNSDIATGEEIWRFAESKENPLEKMRLTPDKKGKMSLTEYLRDETRTTAFMVIRNDTILYEQYFQGYAQRDISTFFSVSKSITSLMVGIAVDEGLIKDINDPITAYIPELREADPMFKNLTVRHLLDMRSGLDYKESYSNPFADMAKLYYGHNQLKQLSKLGFKYEPGTVHQYQSASTALLGIMVEKVSGMDMGKYLEQKVWQPMGMEFPAKWSLDDKHNRSAKGYAGVAATARDLAKIGRLYLKGGDWNGQQIISADWVKASVTPNLENGNYQYQWYGIGNVAQRGGQELVFPDSLSAVAAADTFRIAHTLVDEKERSEPATYHIHLATDEFYAQGILGQILYVDPSSNVIVVRLGEKWDTGLGLLRKVRGYLEEKSDAEGKR
ncbi:MAG: CubicO group peptidase (beta-lactamase class C family) [Neolewinella sp.]|jgi:CubicO group peptidase (beta-lactamase class C family)